MPSIKALLRLPHPSACAYDYPWEWCCEDNMEHMCSLEQKL